jgi:hypothetical protein
MRIAVFSDAKNIEKMFSGVSKSFPAAFFAVKDLKKGIKALGKDTLLYLDISAMTASEARKQIAALAKDRAIPFGIIDPKGLLSDIAEIFHAGGMDYIGKAEAKEGVPFKRIDRTMAYLERHFAQDKECEEGARDGKYITSTGWKNVRSGEEYSFCFMYLELDNRQKLKSRFSAEQLERVSREFHDYVQRQVAPLQGKVWMWMDFFGLILFPFDGKSCEAIRLAFMLMLGQRSASGDECRYDFLLSFRSAIHIGNTVYEARGDTGKIISDSINSIFHLGQKYARPGNLYLTEDVREFVPAGLEKSFLTDGVYEGREILRMRQLV